MQQSLTFVAEQLAALPDTPVMAPLRALAKESLAVSLVEGWRGEICHVAVTDAEGRFARYKITDPSFHNWFGAGPGPPERRDLRLSPLQQELQPLVRRTRPVRARAC